MVRPIPEGYHSLTPYLYVSDGKAAIEFYKRAFGAREAVRMDAPGGKIAHAELRIGDSVVMLADECPEVEALSPKTVGGSPSSLLLYVENVDQVFEQAVKEGASVLRPLANQFYGDRSGGLKDPFGHRWQVSTHVEDVSPEEMKKRMAAMPSPTQS